MRKSIYTVLALALLPASALAQGIEYDYLDFGYVGADAGDGDDDFTGLGVRGSIQFNRDIYFTAEFASTNTDTAIGDLDRTDFAAGVGYHQPLNQTTDVFGEIGFVAIDMDDLGDENGLRLTAGLRSMVAEQLELRGSASYVDIGSSDFVLRFGAQYNFSDLWAGFAEIAEGDDLSGYMVGARYHF